MNKHFTHFTRSTRLKIWDQGWRPSTVNIEKCMEIQLSSHLYNQIDSTLNDQIWELVASQVRFAIQEHLQ